MRVIIFECLFAITHNMFIKCHIFYSPLLSHSLDGYEMDMEVDGAGSV
jgi:hypothetical protein